MRIPHQNPGPNLPLAVRYFPLDPAQWTLPSQHQPFVTLSFRSNQHQIAIQNASPWPHLALDMPQLEDTPLIEVWSGTAPIRYGQDGDIHFATNRQLLFGCCHLAPELPLEEITQHAYRQILHFLAKQTFSYPIRIWNYFPKMNQQGQAIERYQHFCVGRQAAMQEVHLATTLLPSATAVGSSSGALAICFLATHSPGLNLGNPRQMNAYEYPAQYGPSSPSFARATLKNIGDYQYLFISGTASIVGHQSLHNGQPLQQLEEAIRNLEHLLSHASQQKNSVLHDFQAIQSLKVYIRKQAHYPLLKEALQTRFGNQTPTLFVQGDICRKNLLLEIEGLTIAKRS